MYMHAPITHDDCTDIEFFIPLHVIWQKLSSHYHSSFNHFNNVMSRTLPFDNNDVVLYDEVTKYEVDKARETSKQQNYTQKMTLYQYNLTE